MLFYSKMLINHSINAYIYYYIFREYSEISAQKCRKFQINRIVIIGEGKGISKRYILVTNKMKFDIHVCINKLPLWEMFKLYSLNYYLFKLLNQICRQVLNLEKESTFL